jgi:hypothetical protein
MILNIRLSMFQKMPKLGFLPWKVQDKSCPWYLTKHHAMQTYGEVEVYFYALGCIGASRSEYLLM